MFVGVSGGERGDLGEGSEAGNSRVAFLGLARSEV